MNFRRNFLLTMTLAGAIATPVFGQSTAPSADGGAGSGQGPAMIPELSGRWAHPGLGFGPSLSGPGPITNRSRLPSGQSNFNKVAGDYTNPILKPEAADVVKKLGELSLLGQVFPDP